MDGLPESEVVDLQESDDDDDDEIIFTGELDSPGSFTERAVPGVAAPQPDVKTTDSGPSCPICGMALGKDASNQELNDHVDLCLNREAIGDAAKPSPQKKPRSNSGGTGKNDRRQQPPKGSMLAWLKKA